MEIKWGCDRLPGLVAPQTAAKFGSAKAKLDAAIELNVAADVARTASVMLRGWAALDTGTPDKHAHDVIGRLSRRKTRG